jgi:TIR domain-containing protein
MEKPVAFMSYAHRDNVNDALTTLREFLSQAVCLEIGEDFEIFQDSDDIGWGQDWKERIEQGIDEVTFLIPIITPSFFNSQYCREELKRFLDREKELNRHDLVLPIYYRDSRVLNDEVRRETDELAKEVHRHQYADWRSLRNEPFNSNRVKSTLERLARDIDNALDRVRTPIVEAGKSASAHNSGTPSLSQNRSLHAVEPTSLPGRQEGGKRVESATLGAVASINFRPRNDPQAAMEQVTDTDLELAEWLISTIRFHHARAEEQANMGQYERAIAIYSGAVGSILPVLESLVSITHQTLSGLEEA